MNRRAFLGFGARTWLLFATMTAGLSQMAVSCADVFSKIMQYATLGLTAFQSVVDLLAGAGVILPGGGAAIDAVIALVKIAFADLQAAVGQYNAAVQANADAGTQATLKGKISIALAVTQENIQQFWNGLTIPDPKLASLTQGLLGIILSTLAGFATQLPAPVGVPQRQLARRLTVVASQRSPDQFRKAFNGLLAANGKQKYAI